MDQDQPEVDAGPSLRESVMAALMKHYPRAEITQVMRRRIGIMCRTLAMENFVPDKPPRKDLELLKSLGVPAKRLRGRLGKIKARIEADQKAGKRPPLYDALAVAGVFDWEGDVGDGTDLLENLSHLMELLEGMEEAPRIRQAVVEDKNWHGLKYKIDRKLNERGEAPDEQVNGIADTAAWLAWKVTGEIPNVRQQADEQLVGAFVDLVRDLFTIMGIPEEPEPAGEGRDEAGRKVKQTRRRVSPESRAKAAAERLAEKLKAAENSRKLD